MHRVYVVVEGQTEETFIKEVLQPHFGARGVVLQPILFKTKAARGSRPAHRGGVPSFEKVKREIERLLNDKNVSRVTSFLDFYGLADKGFPGWVNLPQGSPYKRVEFLEQEFGNAIGNRRFIPHLALHEFEAMLFTAPARMRSAYPDLTDEQISALQAIRDGCDSPEEINDNKPPSHRIMQLIPEYDKVVAGSLVIVDIGLAPVRECCPHFSQWLSVLESLASPA